MQNNNMENEELVKNLKSKFWRLNNIYYVVNEKGQNVVFKMRPAQKRFFNNMWFRSVILKARQLGFSTFICLFSLDLAFWRPHMRCAIIAHTKDDAKILFRRIKHAYDNLPEAIKQINSPLQRDEGGEIIFKNGSSIRVAVSVRSGVYDLLHISEYGYVCAHDKQKALEIKTGGFPAVHPGSFLFVEATAEGKEGGFYELCDSARKTTISKQESGQNFSDKEFKFFFFPWYENPEYVANPEDVTFTREIENYFSMLEMKHGIKLSLEQMAWYVLEKNNLKEDMRSQHPSFPDEAFDVPLEGAYYHAQMIAAHEEGRIGYYPHVDGEPVNTSWDIGRADANAICFWQEIDGMRRYIDYAETAEEGLPECVAILRARSEQYGYVYGRFVGPHDIGQHNWTHNQMRMQYAYDEYGIKFIRAPRLPYNETIDIVRRTIPNCCFNEATCDRLIAALSSYRKEWNDSLGTWKNTPLHDWASHPATSFGYGCVVDAGDMSGGLSITSKKDKGLKRLPK